MRYDYENYLPKGMPVMKRVLYIVLGLLVLIVAGGAFAISRIDTATLRDKIAEITTEQTGKPLVLQEVPKISIMPLGVTFGPAIWGMVDGKAAAEGISATIQGGKVSLQLAPLFSGTIVIDSIELQSPVIVMRPEAKLAKAQSPAPEAKTETAPQALTLPNFSLGALRISNGTLDLNTGDGPTVHISKLDMELKNLAPNQVASTQYSLHLTVSESTPKGAVTTLVSGTMQQKAQVRLSPTQIDVQGLEQTFTPEKGLAPSTAGPVRLSGALTYALDTGKVILTDLMCSTAHAQLSLKGEGMLQPLSFKGSQSLSTAPDKLLSSLGIKAPLAAMPTDFSLKSTVTFANNTLDMPKFEASLDKKPITGSLRLQLPQQGRAMSIKSVVQAADINLDSYMGSTGAEATTKPASSGTAKGEPLVAPDKVASLPTVDADIQISALTVRKVTLNKLHVQIKGATGRYTVNTTSSLATGGNVDINAGLDLGAQRYSSRGKASQINVGSLLQALQGKSPVSGTAQVDYDLTCGGSTPAAITSNLSGAGTVVVQNIILNGVSILPKDAPTKGGVPSNFERLHVPFTAKNGMVSLNPITLTSPSLNAKGLGTVNLPQENLNISADVVLLGVSLPVVASGPFNNISYGLDPKKVLKNVLSSPETLTRGAGTLLQKGGKTAPDVGSTIKGLFGK